MRAFYQHGCDELARFLLSMITDTVLTTYQLRVTAAYQHNDAGVTQDENTSDCTYIPN